MAYHNPADPRSFVNVSNTDPKLGVERNSAHLGLSFWFELGLLLVVSIGLLVSFLCESRLGKLLGSLGIFALNVSRPFCWRAKARADLVRFPGAAGHRGPDGVSAAFDPKPQTFGGQTLNACLLLFAVLLICTAVGSLWCYQDPEMSGLVLGAGFLFSVVVVALTCVIAGLYHDGIKSRTVLIGSLLLVASVFGGFFLYREVGAIEASLMNGEGIRLRSLEAGFHQVPNGEGGFEQCYYASRGDDAYLVVGSGPKTGAESRYRAYPVVKGPHLFESCESGLRVGVLTEINRDDRAFMEWSTLIYTNGAWSIRTGGAPAWDVRMCPRTLETLRKMDGAARLGAVGSLSCRDSTEASLAVREIISELESKGLLRESDGPSFDLTIRLKTCYLLQFRNWSGSVAYIRVAIPSGETHRIGVPGEWLDMSSYPFHPFHARYLAIRSQSGKDRYVWDSETEEIVSFPGFTVRNACGNDVFLLADREGNLFVRRLPESGFWREARFLYRIPEEYREMRSPWFLVDSILDGHRYAVGYGCEVLPESRDAVCIMERNLLFGYSFLEVRFENGEARLYVRPTDGLPPEAVNGIPVTHWKLSDDRRELVVDYRGVQKHISL